MLNRLVRAALLLGAMLHAQALPVWAGEVDPDDPVRVAAAADAAETAKDAGALAKLAAVPTPDPWLVVDELLRRGKKAVAARFAAAAPEDLAKRLGAAIEAEPAAGTATRVRAALLRSAKHSREAEFAEAAAALEIEAVPSGILGVRWLWTRAVARAAIEHRTVEQLDRCCLGAADDYEASGALAQKLGWLTRSSEAFYRAGYHLWNVRSGDHGPRILSLFQRHRNVEERLDSAAGRGRGAYRVARALPRGSTKLTAYLEEARGLLERAGDKEYLGKTLGMQSEALADGNKTEEASLLACKAASLLDAADGKGLHPRFRPDRIRLEESRANARLACAALAERLGHLDRALAHQASARQAAERSGYGWLIATVAAHSEVLTAESRRRTGDLEGALSSYRKALATFEGMQLVSEAADVRRRLADTLRAGGDLDLALETVRKAARAIGGSSGSAARRTRLMCRLVEGRVLTSLRDFESASSVLAFALEDARALGSRDLEGTVLLRLAAIPQFQGRYALALIELEHVIELATRHKLLELRAIASLTIAEVLLWMRAPGKAKDWLRRAREAYSQLGHGAGLREVSRQEVRVLLDAGEHDAARTLLNALLAQASKDGRVSGVVFARRRLAWLARFEGRHADALRHWQELARHAAATEDRLLAAEAALGVARAQFWMAGTARESLERLADLRSAREVLLAEGSRQEQVRANLTLVQALHKLARHAEAVAIAEESFALVADFGLGLAEGEAALARADYIDGLFRTGVRSAISLESPAATYRFMERARAGSLAATLGGARALRDADVPPALLRRLAAARAQDAGARAALTRAQRLRSTDRIAKATAQRDQAEAALRAAMTSIRRAVRGRANLAYGEVLPLAEFQSLLKPRDVALMFMRYTGNDGQRYPVVLRIDPSAASLHKLCSGARCDEVLGALYSGSEGRIQESAVAQLRDLLFGNLDLQGARRLLISPGVEFARVPFGLLKGRCHDVVLIPSATVMGMLRRTASADRGSQVLALGNAVYGQRGDTLWNALPATAAEAQVAGDVVLLGKEASEKRFYETLLMQARWLAVHFACHGDVHMDDATRSALVISEDEEHDGMLTAREVFGLNIPADLVVLSGCETGRGQVIKGDGLTGLMRAFMQAGSPRVLCSLWKVDDSATSALMTKFYEVWKPAGGRVSAAHALRIAQAHVRAQPKWRHPEYWGAWVLWGLPD